jgi:seryl-tRNA(Sec) selenium transferase
VTVRPETGGVVALEATVRDASPPVIGRVAQDALYLDLLALAESEVAELVESVVWALLRVQSARSQAGDRGSAGA